ncbi:MAG: DUF2177 family protein [Sphingomonadales bacterium]|nr:DUF2177 family protein [Sphingomonadales bacterium]
MLAKLLTAYAVTALIFGALDAIWLRFASPALYRPALGDLLADKFRVGPAIAFYVIYVAAITYFAVFPGLLSADAGNASFFAGPRLAVVHGAIVGLVCYATYDLTNQATLKNWPVHVTLIDLAWGTAATALATGLSTLVMIRFFGGLAG